MTDNDISPAPIPLGDLDDLLDDGRLGTVDDIDNLSPAAYRVRERRARRHAAAQGLRLRKCPTRVQESPLFGTYMLVDADRETIEVAGSPDGYGLGLDDIEDALRARIADDFREQERRLRSERIRASRSAGSTER